MSCIDAIGFAGFWGQLACDLSALLVLFQDEDCTRREFLSLLNHDFCAAVLRSL